MAENKSARDEGFEQLSNIAWSFDDRFCTCFLFPKESARLRDIVSFMRRNYAITMEERGVINELIKMGEKRYLEFLIKITNQPRVDAQKFIGKKNVRAFIFLRDGERCLRCNSIEKLSLDHIVPVNKKGDNTISNLQTLCCSCNSWKSDKIIDFRNGARVLPCYLKTTVKR